MTQSKYFWITDPHFNFLRQPKIVEFCLKLHSYQPQGIFLTGDISTGKELAFHLQLISKSLSCPIYFVLGNHDFYYASLAGMRHDMSQLTQQNSKLHYLSVEEPISLTNDTAIIGQDGWYDAGWKEPFLPIVFWADWYFISDFRLCKDNASRIDLMKYQAKLASEKLKISLEKALETHSTVYLLTHFPPWPEKNDKWYGLIENFWTPYNSCKITANMLSSVMNEHPEQKLIVLAGHTHCQRYEKITHNIELKVGCADHGRCQIQDIICL